MKDGFNKMFHQYKGRIYAYALAITKSEYIAEEVTQEIFIKLWTTKDQLHEINNLDGYIFKIAKNLSLNYLRKIANSDKMTTELIRVATDSTGSTDSKMNVFDYNKLISEAVDGLSPQRKLVFKLSKEEELSYDEIALQLNLSKNTVKNHHLSAIGTVRSFLIKNGISSALTLLLLLKTHAISHVF